MVRGFSQWQIKRVCTASSVLAAEAARPASHRKFKVWRRDQAMASTDYNMTICAYSVIYLRTVETYLCAAIHPLISIPMRDKYAARDSSSIPERDNMERVIHPTTRPLKR